MPQGRCAVCSMYKEFAWNGICYDCMDKAIIEVKHKEKNDKNPEQVLMAGGKVASSKIPALHLIPTVALTKLAERFELGVERKGDKVWNALSDNQECLADRDFLIERCSHIMLHAMKLRDQLVNGESVDAVIDGDFMADNASAIMWGGCFLTCAAEALSKDVPVPRNEKEQSMLSTMDESLYREAMVEDKAAFDAIYKEPWTSSKEQVFNAAELDAVASLTTMTEQPVVAVFELSSYMCNNNHITGPLKHYIDGDDHFYGSPTNVKWDNSGKAVRIDQGMSEEFLRGYDIKRSGSGQLVKV